MAMELENGKVFVGGISWDTNEERLNEYFSGFGEVVEAVIMKDRATGRARGFGFIVFADPAVAERIVLEKHMIDGRLVEAKKAVPRDDQSVVNRSNNILQFSLGQGSGRTKKIFVGGLASTVTEADFRNYFEQFGTITDVVVMYDHNTQRPRGFGFITFDSENAVDNVLVKTFHELNGKMVEVKRAVPKELSPGPTIRSPLGGFNNYSPNRVNSFLSSYPHGYTPSLISGYGTRMENRFSPLAGGRNGFPSLATGYGLGLNFKPGMSPNYGGNSVINTIGYGRALDPYFSGNSNRYPGTIGYSGANGTAASNFSSVARNVLGNSGLSYTTSSPGSNSLLAPGSGNFGGFGISSLSWGESSSPVSAQAVGNNANYSSGIMGFGSGDNNLALGTTGYGRNTGASSMNTYFSTSGNVYNRNLEDTYNNSSISGDATWRSQTELDNSDPFGYVLGTEPSDVAGKGASSYIGGYNIINRQTNRGIAA